MKLKLIEPLRELFKGARGRYSALIPILPNKCGMGAFY
jgi:GMP synthase PP-ATPase subunit